MEKHVASTPHSWALTPYALVKTSILLFAGIG